MTEPVWPLLLAARAAMGLCAVAWIAAIVRRAGLAPTRWLSAVVLALYLACIGSFVGSILGLRFPPEQIAGSTVWEARAMVWRCGDLLAEMAPFIVLLPVLAGVACWRARRSCVHALAEAATWCVVTLPLVWLWHLSQIVPGFHGSWVYVACEHIVDLAAGPWIAAAAAVCAVVLRRWARRGDPGPARTHWLVFVGPLALLVVVPRWSTYSHARAVLPGFAVEGELCRFDGPQGLDVWPAGPELCGERERIEVWCRDFPVHIALWQAGASAPVHIDAGDEADYAAPPSVAALVRLFAQTREVQERRGWERLSAAFWPSRAMSGPELAAWVSVLTAAGVDDVTLFARLEHVEQHPLYGELVRFDGCPIGQLNAGDLAVVETWDRLDSAVLSGALRALQGDRVRPPIRGDGSPRDLEFRERYADWPQ